MKDFTKTERKQIIKESLKTAFQISILFMVPCFIMMLMVEILSLVSKAQTKEGLDYAIVILPLFVGIFMFVLMLFAGILCQKNNINKKKIIEEKRKYIDLCFKGNCLWVEPIKDTDCNELLNKLSTFYEMRYYASIEDDIAIAIYVQCDGDENKEIRVEEINKENFLEAYKILKYKT